MNRAGLTGLVHSTLLVHDGIEFPEKTVDLVIKRTLEVIAMKLTDPGAEDGVFLTGLGRIKAVDRAARKVKTPAGKVIEVPARKGFKFYPVKALLEDLNGE